MKQSINRPETEPGAVELSRPIAKVALRANMQRLLALITVDERRRASEQICARILTLPQWQEAQNVMLFSPLKTEPDLRFLRDDPGSASKRMSVLPPIADFDLLKGLAREGADVILVPGLAFTRAGERLGRGGGYFDRLLGGALRDAYKIGLCFRFQLLTSLPQEAHDVRVDTVITDGRSDYFK